MDVLRQLPARPGINAEAIDGIARVIVSAYAIGSVAQAPHLKRKGSVRAGRRLKELLEHIVAAHNLINEMPLEAHEALDIEIDAAKTNREANEAAGRWFRRDRVDPAHIFAEQLHGFALAVARAGRRVTDGPQTTTGRPKESCAFMVANQAVWAYEEITGKRATITVKPYKIGNPSTGKFLEFLQELYAALEIDASAAVRAKDAIAFKKHGGSRTL